MAEKIAPTKKKNVLIVILCSLLLVSVFVVGYYLKNASTGDGTDKRTSQTSLQENAKKWLVENLKDPSSVQFIEWSNISKTNDGYYSMHLKYRAKNSFNAFVVEGVVFNFDTVGSVVSAQHDSN